MKKKIIFYTENYERGGGNQYLIDLVNATPSNYDVVIASNPQGLCREDFNKINRQFQYEEVSVFTLPLLIKGVSNKALCLIVKGFLHFFRNSVIKHYQRKNIKLLTKLIEKHNPSAVFSANGGFLGGLSCLDCVLAAKSLNKRVFLSVVSMPQDKSSVNLLYRNVFDSVDSLIVNSNAIAQEFIIRKFKENKIFILYNCLKEDKILDNYIVPRKYDSTSTSFVIGYTGRIEEAKGIFYLLEAFKKLNTLFKNTELVLVGTGKHLEQVKQVVTEMQLEDVVKVMGYYNGEISEVLATMDLFVFPSIWEGLPYSVLEAMAQSKIVIATNVGGIPEVIKNGVNGFLVPPKSSEALYLNMKYALESEHLNSVCENALETIKKNFSESYFQKNIQRIFKFE